MKAIVSPEPLPISSPASLVDVELPTPTPGPRDLLVEVRSGRRGLLCRTTLKERRALISAPTLREAHAQIESGTTIGKIVLEGWE